jgi:hypothetical protein
MKKWEYLQIKFNKLPDVSDLDHYGNEGWELCHIVESFKNIAFFKREAVKKDLTSYGAP